MNKKRKALYDKTNGRCAYCGITLEKGWHADHIEPVMRQSKVCKKTNKLIQTGKMDYPERDTVENMVASCPPCNQFKGVYSLEDFRVELQKQLERARTYSVNFRMAEKYGLIMETGREDIRFYFEKPEANS